LWFLCVLAERTSRILPWLPNAGLTVALNGIVAKPGGLRGGKNPLITR
jgi:hypothetical protein